MKVMRLAFCRTSFLIVALIVPATGLAPSAGAQEPADRDRLVAFRDSVSSSDLAALQALEQQMIQFARMNRDDALQHVKLGFVGLRLGDLGKEGAYEDAASEFEWASELQPTWPYPWYGLGLAEARIGDYVASSGAQDPAAALHASVDGWLAACEEPEVRQILLLDGPVVLGWIGFRDMALRHALGLTEALLQAAIDAGQLAAQPTRALAHVLIGALDEAALYLTTSDDRASAHEEVARVLHAMVDGLLDGER